MGDKTPKRSVNLSDLGFSPVILPESPAAASPQKNLTGLPRVLRDLIADVYNEIQRWNDLHIKGAAVVKKIATIKRDNPFELSSNLEDATNELYGIVQVLKLRIDNLFLFLNQLKASEKLDKAEKVLFISRDFHFFVAYTETVVLAYEAEFKMKQHVLNNIAFSKNVDDAMFLAALWTYQTKITDDITLKLEALLLETGHRKII